MKKIFALLLTMLLLLSLTACRANQPTGGDDAEHAVNISETDVTEENQEQAGETDTEETAKPISTPSQSPTKAPAKPSEKPAEQQKPTKAPEKQPEATTKPAPKTLGNTLLADFKEKAAAGMSAQEIAEGLLANGAIAFAGGAMPVEEGLLAGFDNAEITGFKTGVMFAPMIGSIPFVGYVFELENAADTSGFIATLEKNANRRWNICVEADETVTGSAGNKVFFVMCPTALEE